MRSLSTRLSPAGLGIPLVLWDSEEDRVDFGQTPNVQNRPLDSTMYQISYSNVYECNQSTAYNFYFYHVSIHISVI